jgi:hypothetical protein
MVALSSSTLRAGEWRSDTSKRLAQRSLWPTSRARKLLTCRPNARAIGSFLSISNLDGNNELAAGNPQVALEHYDAADPIEVKRRPPF